MPNWKKVIVSGSDAVLNNITVTGDVTVQGDIIAENYIISSSVTYMTQSFFDGSTIFGNDGTDTHQFTGSLYLSQSVINLDYGGRIFGTPPGDINIWPATDNDLVSIKGNLLAPYITASDAILVGGIIQGPPSPTNPLWSINAIGLGTFDSLTVNGTVNLKGTTNNYGNGANDKHTFTGNITASNDISASGDIYGNSYVVQNVGVIALSGTDTINFGNNYYNSQYKGISHYFPAAITASIISASSDLYAGLDEDNNTSYKTVVYNTTTGQFFYTGSYGGGEDTDWYIDTSNNQLTSSLDIYVKSNITASNNISASNYIYANNIWLGNQKFAHPGATTSNFVIGSGGDGSLVLTNITASGNISASGHLFANTSNAAGNYNSVLVVDTASGQFYYTGSYGSGGETTLPGGDRTYVQYSGSSGFDGDSGLTYGPQTNTLRVGTTVPQTVASGLLKQSGSHFAVDGKALITNAEVVKWTSETPQSENYILVGLGRGNATDPATGNSYLTLDPGDGLAQANGNNASPLLGGLNQQEQLGNLSGARVNGALKIGGVYANYRTDTGWLVYANGFVSVPGSPGIAVRNGGIEIFSSESYAGDPEGSGSIASPRASASAVFTLASDSSSLLLQVGKEDLRDVMFISRSGDNPRIGIGTDNPLTNFDFKDVSDSREGTKMILRSSRPTKGGNNGDEAGKINFVIDSSSYGDIETSGSVAKILGSATSIGTDGAAGKLSFEVSDVYTPKEDTTEVFRLQKNPFGTLDLTYTVGVFEGSVNLNGANSSLYAGKDVEAGGNFFTIDGYIQSTNGYVRANNLRIGTNDDPGTNSAIIAGDLILNNDFTSSGDISSSGDIIANNGSFSGNLTVQGDIVAENYIVSSSVTYMTQSFSSGSTIFGDTSDDTHQFTGSVDVSGTGQFGDDITITSGSYNVETYNEGLRFYNGSNYTTNKIQLTSVQNMQFSAGGSFQFNPSSGQLQLLQGKQLQFNNSVNDGKIRMHNGASSGLARLDFEDDSNNELMSISSSGNVGIGTTTPPEKLTVAGNISASGDLQLDNTITFTGETNTIVTNWSGGEGTIKINPEGQLYLGEQSTNNVYIGRTNNASYETIIYGGDTTENIKVSLNSVELNVPVTASSDISASGQFIGANFGLDSTDKLQFSTETLQIRLGDASKYTITPTVFRPTDDEGASLGRSADKWKELVVNHITASGNISASGDVIGATGSFDVIFGGTF